MILAIQSYLMTKNTTDISQYVMMAPHEERSPEGACRTCFYDGKGLVFHG